ncbi:hypothetical protein E3N88_07356 [Mikania micrantha]|uniref:Uncharacterized protein n=1 Tax=Mikania micrantha TaxID=192012 RepID=A0A5N6PTQ1_9ASTR|nr:hypothetical protein E3N88_07356 [Mikania micrantha]
MIKWELRWKSIVVLQVVWSSSSDVDSICICLLRLITALTDFLSVMIRMPPRRQPPAILPPPQDLAPHSSTPTPPDSPIQPPPPPPPPVH